MLKKRIAIAIALIICLFNTSILTACEKVSVTELGMPTSNRFETGVLARCVWDMKIWNNALYIGSGDYDNNTSPADIWAYDFDSGEWRCSGTVQDEAIARFSVINQSLMVPGVDPVQGWDLGNYYQLTDGEWQTKRILPNAIHTFDMIEFEDNIFAGIGSNNGYYPCLISKDGGQTYTHVKFYKNGGLYDFTQYEYSRSYEMFEFNGVLYALVWNKVYENGVKLELFNYVNECFHYVRDAKDFYHVNRISVNYLNAKGQFNDKFFFSSDYLYVSENLTKEENSVKVELPYGEKVSQFKIIGDKMYVLCYEQNIETQTYKIRMYVSESGIDDFDELFCVEYDVPPLCFDKDGRDFYVGLGDGFNVKDNNGLVLKVFVRRAK